MKHQPKMYTPKQINFDMVSLDLTEWSLRKTKTCDQNHQKDGFLQENGHRICIMIEFSLKTAGILCIKDFHRRRSACERQSVYTYTNEQQGLS